VEAHGTFPLSEQDNSDLWQRIRAVHLEEMSSSQRAGVPDEVQYTFRLQEEAAVYEVSIWINDARQDDQIVTLVDQIGALIEKYTGEMPVLK
jgi:hypothetical protein